MFTKLEKSCLFEPIAYQSRGVGFLRFHTKVGVWFSYQSGGVVFIPKWMWFSLVFIPKSRCGFACKSGGVTLHTKVGVSFCTLKWGCGSAY